MLKLWALKLLALITNLTWRSLSFSNSRMSPWTSTSSKSVMEAASFGVSYRKTREGRTQLSESSLYQQIG